MSSMISNIIESFVPIVPARNYAPTRTFVTKWDVEIENNRTKKISRRRERDTKYFEDFDQHGDSLPPIVILSEYQDDNYNNDDDIYSSDDGDGEETNQKWLRSVHAENAYYEKKYGNSTLEWYELAGFDEQAPRKRFLNAEFDSDQSLFKRSRA